MQAAVAAGHPATVAAGIEILEEGGSAADAAVAACLASCVAETVMTGLLGGGHAIHWDGREAVNLDCFVTVPSGSRCPADRPRRSVRRGGRPLRGRAGYVRRSRTPRGARRALGAVRAAALAAARRARAGARAHGRDRAARSRFVPRDAGAGLHAHRRRARDLRAGRTRCSRRATCSRSRGLPSALEVLADEGPSSAYRGTLAERAAVRRRGSPVTRADLESLRAALVGACGGLVAGHRFLTRGGLAGVPETLERLPRLAGLVRDRARAHAPRRARGHGA